MVLLFLSAMPDPPTEAPKSRRGGKRPGAGRKKKGLASPTAIAGLDLDSALKSPPPDEIESVAKRQAGSSIEALVKLLKFGASESAKISSANEVLDRGYGKPTVEAGGDAMLPFFGQAPAVQPTIGSEIRDEARKYAHLAIEVLKRIRDNGQSENARASAAKSLLNRGLGTVAPARMLDELFDKPAGKKEEAARTAKAVGTGKFATPAPPKMLSDTMQ